jgi:glucose-6-phosphate isomerase
MSAGVLPMKKKMANLDLASRAKFASFSHMRLSARELWDRFRRYSTAFPTLGLSIDLSRMNFADDYFESMRPVIEKAFDSMATLECGAIANPDEQRMVGHYWLRDAAMAPKPEIVREIKDNLREIATFTAELHNNSHYSRALVIGIGGSALGPQFLASALGCPARNKIHLDFFDNTDPDGMDRVLAQIGPNLDQTLCLVISKSGGTKETRNGMLEAKEAYIRAGVDFASHAVAVTGRGSGLDQLAEQEGWLRRFPMWDWVGGRTSVTSAVGLLPAALQGIKIDELLEGAKACDAITRIREVTANPSAQLALMWYYAGSGRGEKDMVILPYKDRLEFFARYLQQLIMESLGKEFDLDGKVVNQGIAVYGNKGSTDQHAYVQQLRDGLNNFFVTFIRVLADRSGPSIPVEPNVVSGDYLHGFLLGTRQALYEKGRESITITVDEISPFSLGVLIALYERAVGFYASLVNINAYHQPGVEAGKRAAGQLLSLQRRIIEFLGGQPGQSYTAEEIGEKLGSADEAESIYKLCEHLSANPGRAVIRLEGRTTSDARYQARD